MYGLRIKSKRLNTEYCQVSFKLRIGGNETYGLMRVKAKSTLKEVVGQISQRIEQADVSPANY